MFGVDWKYLRFCIPWAVIAFLVNVAWAISDADHDLGPVRVGIHIFLALGSMASVMLLMHMYNQVKPQKWQSQEWRESRQNEPPS